MFGSIVVTYRGAPRFKTRTVNRFKKDTLTRVAFQWHSRFHRKHYTTAGARAYGYARRLTKDVRSGKVRRSKSGRPLAPSGDPLVWSGRSRSLAQRVRVRATSRGSRATMPVRALNFRNPRNPIDMRHEATVVLDGEAKSLRSDAKKYLTERFRGYKQRTVVVIQ